MSLNYIDLDDSTKKFMLEEIEFDKKITVFISAIFLLLKVRLCGLLC